MSGDRDPPLTLLKGGLAPQRSLAFCVQNVKKAPTTQRPLLILKVMEVMASLSWQRPTRIDAV
jgi:hypothetical protein